MKGNWCVMFKTTSSFENQKQRGGDTRCATMRKRVSKCGLLPNERTITKKSLLLHSLAHRHVRALPHQYVATDSPTLPIILEGGEPGVEKWDTSVKPSHCSHE
ncbi:hypothetical protein TRVL_06074 [Trypanosoma vivax]|nr:hypothetical protein TRVL_06074 [Trypanosoma vivax]